MTATALPENYCVCIGDDGAPREIGRNGAAITYKAMGYQSGQAVALQLIPLADVSEAGRAQFELKVRALRKLKHPNIARAFDVRVEDEHLVFPTEFLQGETAERWVVTHGPMPPDATLRVALQVVSALAEAAFHSLSHRAIQPSNLMIVAGAAPDGDWPFIKLTNFGLAGLKLYSEGSGELVPTIGPAFASPEQLEKGKVDFRSEIFSLGATMCFLLTGDVPVAGRTRKSGVAERVLPSGASIPRPIRRLLRNMMRVNADERPRDPLLLTDELQKCLRKVQRRRALRRRESIPLETVETQQPPQRNEAPLRWSGPILTAATILLLLAAFGLVLLPGQMRWWARQNRPLESIGVPIGVDESAPRNEKMTSPSPASVAENSPASATPAASTSPMQAPVIAENSPATLPPEVKPMASPSPPEISVTQQAPEPMPSPTSIAESSPASPSAANASPEPTQAPIVAESSPAVTPPEAKPTASPSPPEISVAQQVPAPTPEIAVPIPQESPATTPAEVTKDETTTEPQPPGEAPPEAVASPSPPQNVAPVIAQEEPPGPSPKIEDLYRPENTAPAMTPPAKSARTPKPSRASSVRTETATSRRKRSSRAASAPTLRVGTEQARRVGTTNEGNWVLRLPSGETVITPPVPNAVDDAPVISHRKVRKVKQPPRTLPPDDRPPILVLPPEN